VLYITAQPSNFPDSSSKLILRSVCAISFVKLENLNHITLAMAPEAPKKLVLCFDGTSNKFNANEADTNIVRIYQMLDRNTSDQFHYYQRKFFFNLHYDLPEYHIQKPTVHIASSFCKSLTTSLAGIGTYTEGPMTNSTNNGWFKNMRTTISKTVDSMVGTSFVHHVVAGYQFILRYYSAGDKIYIFGFSRGAYTARYLCEMIDSIGLLSRGNDEMIRFAWDTFSDYQRVPGVVDPYSELGMQEQWKSFDLPGNDDEESQEGNKAAALYTVPEDQTYKRPSSKAQTKEEALKYMLKFRETYCRKECVVHFLGLFDCVGSVNQFDASRLSSPDILRVPADFVRHAVSIDERRIKFKPYLFSTKRNKYVGRELKEVWFAGNHGDVGGGWDLKIKPGCNVKPQYLLSDIALQWMVQEVRDADQRGKSYKPVSSCRIFF
jgi:uncharacterized protein (DUF2235 family)